MITVDGSYAARLTRSGASWYPERLTLDGPEPYAVRLPGDQPEEPGTEVLPMADGRVLVHRPAGGRHTFSLLYPTGPGTGEVPLGAVECPEPGTRMRLLPPAPDGTRAYALAVGPSSTAVWQVAGGACGPEHLAEVPGRCSGGVWLGGGNRLLALDRESPQGRTKAVVVDLERAGEMSPLLQISEESNDRLLLADADSGLLLIRSDAPSPGRERLGWGVLGSTLPVRFPECLQPAGCTVTPFAIQPGLVLTPESCAVALRIDGAGGSWLGVWRPAERHLHHFRAPQGWLTGSGRWTRDGVLHLPYATEAVPCGVSRVWAPTWAGVEGAGTPGRTAEVPEAAPGPSVTRLPEPAAPRPVPLQQAPLPQTPVPQAPVPQAPVRQAPLTVRVVASAFAGRRAAQATMGRGQAFGEGAGEGPSTGAQEWDDSLDGPDGGASPGIGSGGGSSTGGSPGQDPGGGADQSSGRGVGADQGSGRGTGRGSGAGPAPGSGTGTCSGPGTGPGTGPGADSGADSGAGSGAGSGHDPVSTDSGPPHMTATGLMSTRQEAGSGVLGHIGPAAEHTAPAPGGPGAAPGRFGTPAGSHSAAPGRAGAATNDTAPSSGGPRAAPGGGPATRHPARAPGGAGAASGRTGAAADGAAGAPGGTGGATEGTVPPPGGTGAATGSTGTAAAGSGSAEERTVPTGGLGKTQDPVVPRGSVAAAEPPARTGGFGPASGGDSVAAGTPGPAVEHPAPVAGRSVSAPSCERVHPTGPVPVGVGLDALPRRFPREFPSTRTAPVANLGAAFGSTSSAYADVRPTTLENRPSTPSEPVWSLRVEQVGAEAPAAFRTLRMAAGANPSPSPLKVTPE